MEFEWDPAKEAINRAKHGFTFQDAATVFDDPRVVIEDSSKPEHGEPRALAVGMVAGRLAAVVFTDRPTGRRIISARRARTDERARYDQGAAPG